MNRLTPPIFHNWSSGDAENFAEDLTATGHFNRPDVDGLMQNIRSDHTYCGGFPVLHHVSGGSNSLRFKTGRGLILFQSTTPNLWVLEQQLEDFLESQNYKF